MITLKDGKYDYQQLPQGRALVNAVNENLLQSRVIIPEHMKNSPYDHIERITHEMCHNLAHALKESGKVNIEKRDYMKDWVELGIQPPPHHNPYEDEYEMGVVVFTIAEFNSLMENYTKSLVEIKRLTSVADMMKEFRERKE
ncbi:hypothetical protein F400_gp046 [Bacillus phage BCD7]|uniref:Uncharacterized protein n=1 Tax=Bacillus phage BCD7 TaxID=1136534 RepID=J9PTY2_9CAUD|nr:hypothetical protein F400_gp046 [Bacillus phage BCD7]AEZ50493.1 hypothetical protein BCD7_0046 [Bacillus phage BCD7]